MSENELSIPAVYCKDEAIGYGGNQEWFSHEWKKRARCGCTSGTNLAAYYAAKYPAMIGYPYLKKFGRQFVRYCREHGIHAKAEFCGERQIVNAHELFEVHRKNTIRMVSFRILTE